MSFEERTWASERQWLGRLLLIGPGLASGWVLVGPLGPSMGLYRISPPTVPRSYQRLTEETMKQLRRDNANIVKV